MSKDNFTKYNSLAPDTTYIYNEYKTKITKNTVEIQQKNKNKYKSTQRLLQSLENISNLIKLSFEIYNNSLFVVTNNIPLIIIDGEMAYKSMFNSNIFYNVNIIKDTNIKLSKLKSDIENNKNEFYSLIIDSYAFRFFNKVIFLDSNTDSEKYINYKFYSMIQTKNIINDIGINVVVDIENSTTLFPLLSEYMDNVTLIYSTYNKSSIPNVIKEKISKYNLYEVPFQQKDSADIAVIMYSSYISNVIHGDVILFTCDHFAKVMQYLKNDLLSDNDFYIFCNINNFFSFLDLFYQ